MTRHEGNSRRKLTEIRKVLVSLEDIQAQIGLKTGAEKAFLRTYANELDGKLRQVCDSHALFLLMAELTRDERKIRKLKKRLG